MLEIFLISLREAIQAVVVSAPALALGPYPIDKKRYYLFIGLIVSIAIGFPLGYISYNKELPIGNEGWQHIRYAFEFLLFYLGIFVFSFSLEDRARPVMAGLLVYGFLIFFFEARVLGFLAHDKSLIEGKSQGALFIVASISAILLGLSVLYPISLFFKRFPIYKAISLPGLLIYSGALKFLFGGVSEVEEGSFIITLQRGLQYFLENALSRLESVLMISSHPFLESPFSALLTYLKGDRTAMAIAVVLIIIPPVYMLIRLFGRADPFTSDLKVKAERRLKVSFFRKNLFYLSAPALISFFVLIISLHAANLALNPLYEPEPIPVRTETDTLKIPISDQFGDLSDGKLRKYVYYYGDKRIIFIAIMKPDGGAGVALDECEICRPAEWNKSAQGYAQSGSYLICKYCVTPIAISTINKPGGCNPIPVPFRLEEGHIIISLDDLIRIYKSAQALDKKGTHL